MSQCTRQAVRSSFKVFGAKSPGDSACVFLPAHLPFSYALTVVLHECRELPKFRGPI